MIFCHFHMEDKDLKFNIRTQNISCDHLYFCKIDRDDQRHLVDLKIHQLQVRIGNFHMEANDANSKILFDYLFLKSS